MGCRGWGGGGRAPSRGEGEYLAGALPDGVNELLDNEVHALEARLLQLHHLLLHNGLECQIWGEQPGPGGRGGEQRGNG